MIHAILQIFIYILIFDVVMSYFPQLKHHKWARILHEIADVPQRPIRDLMPRDLPLDPTPMILILVIQFIMYLL
jgi:YggT family protein